MNKTIHKTCVKNIRTYLDAIGKSIGQAQGYEVLARAHNLPDANTLAGVSNNIVLVRDITSRPLTLVQIQESGQHDGMVYDYDDYEGDLLSIGNVVVEMRLSISVVDNPRQGLYCHITIMTGTQDERGDDGKSMRISREDALAILAHATIRNGDKPDPQKVKPFHKRNEQDHAERLDYLQSMYDLQDVVVSHAMSCIDTEYDDECVVKLANGRELRSPAYPNECDYIRVMLEGYELMYWNSDEIAEDAANVMGAVFGLAHG